jgi:hypothetical protein
MSTYRIQTNLIDRSQVAIPNNSVVGAMVIKASKGPKTPVFINKGDTDRIINLFGAPSVTPTTSYVDVYEAVKFNEQDAMWLSSAYPDTDTYGGAMVTAYGTVPLSAGLAASAIDVTTPAPSFAGNFTAWDRELVGTGDGALTTFAYSTVNAPIATISNTLFYLYINGVQQTLTIAGTAPNFTIACAGVLTGTSSTYNTTTKAMSLVFTTFPAAGAKIEVRYASPTATGTSNFFYVLSRSPYADDLSIVTTYNSTLLNWNIAVYKTTLGALVPVNDYTISFTPLAKDGFGKSIYYQDVLLNNDYIQVIYNSSASITTFQNDVPGSLSSAAVAFVGGSRTVPGSITTALLITAWNFYKLPRTYTANIFMSTVADVLIVQLFDLLRTTYQTYAKFILPLPLASGVATAVSDKSGYSVNNRGLRFYWNWGQARTQWGTFWTPLVGRIGAKHAQMKNIFFGKAPAWIDEDSHGGQLGPGIVQMAFDPTEDQLQLLDTNGINPVINDPVYGTMIVSQKTAQNPMVLSDTSYIGHSDVIDYIFDNMINLVLTYQVCKLNDPAHRSLAEAKAYQLTNPIVDSGVLRECIHKCDAGNNTDEVMAQRKFILTTAIKVTPFSERVIFNIIVTEQGAKLSQVLA